MSDRKEFRDLASPEAAREAIDSLDLSPAPETVPLEDARGRVLAERVDAAIDVPGFDRASMDGYAVRARDTFGADEVDPAELDLVGAVHAGAAPDVTVEPGTCAEISTGAVMPDGADAVVMVERTDEVGGGPDDGDPDDERSEPDRIAVRTAVAPGDHVMSAGADIAAGARALGPGTRLTPREIGLLSALGVDEVPVRGRPRVGIVSTGDELVRPGDELDPSRGEIYDVNSTTIAAGVEEAGGVDRRELRPGRLGTGAKGGDQRLGPVEFGVGTEVDLVEQDECRHLDLFDEEVRQGAVVRASAAFGDRVVVEGVEKASGVEDGHERVQAVAGGGGGIGGEQARDRRGFGDARGLHHQRVEVALAGETDDRGLQVVAEFTTDTAVREFGDRPAQIRPLGEEFGVDVHLAHIVDEDRDVAVGVGQ